MTTSKETAVRDATDLRAMIADTRGFERRFAIEKIDSILEFLKIPEGVNPEAMMYPGDD